MEDMDQARSILYTKRIINITFHILYSHIQVFLIQIILAVNILIELGAISAINK